MGNYGGKRMGAGRKRGGKNATSLEKERVLNLVKQKIMERAEALLDAQFSLAIGDKTREPNNNAIDSLLNRAFGKASQSIDLTSIGKPIPLLGNARNRK
jgi:hypothetical protein